jgi:ribosome-binding factor A
MAHRIERVNTEIRKELSQLIQRHLRDPRIDSFLTVTAVETSPDLKYAKVFVSSIGGEEQQHDSIRALTKAAGFRRTELARQIRLRRMPELSFHWDNSIEHGDKILRMLDEIKNENPTE